MSKLDALRKEFKAKNEERERLSIQIGRLREAVNSAKDRMQNAAANGDVDEYIRLKGEVERAEAALYVTETRMNSPVVADKKTALDAWKEYDKGHVSRMSAALVKLEQAKRDFVKAFDAAVAEQDATLTIRKECADLCGADQNEFSLSKEMTVGSGEVAYRNTIEFIIDAKGINGAALAAAEPRINYNRVIKAKVAR